MKKNCQILVADESESLSRHLLQLLTNEGYQVVIVRNNQQAIYLLNHQAFDLVITDNKRPGLNGSRLCQWIKQNQATQSIVVLLIAALSEPEEILSGIEKGADYFMIAPYPAQSFIRLVKSALEGGSKPEQDPDSGSAAAEKMQIIFKDKTYWLPSFLKFYNLLTSSMTAVNQQDNSLSKNDNGSGKINFRLPDSINIQSPALNLAPKNKHLVESKLDISQKKYQKLFESSRDYIIITDLRGNIIDINNHAVSQLGYLREQILQANISLLHRKEDLPLIKHSYRQLLSGSNKQYEIQLKKRDGHYFLAEVSSSLFHIQDHEYIQNIYHDITDRKKAEEKIIHLNNVLQAVRNVNRLIVKEKNKKKLIQQICKIFCENRGYFRTMILLFDQKKKIIARAYAGYKKNNEKMIKQFDSQKIPGCIRYVLATGDFYTSGCFDKVNKKCVFNIHALECGVMIAPLKYLSHFYGVLLVVLPDELISDQEEFDLFKEVTEDISFALYDIELSEKHKHVLKELKTSKKRYTLATQSAKIGVWDWNVEKNQFYLDPVIWHLLGYRRDYKQNIRKFYSLIHPEDKARTRSQVILYLRGLSGELFLEHRVKQARGNVLWFQTRGVTIRNKRKKVIRMVGTIADITERKRAEIEQQNLRDQLYQSEKLSEIGQLAAGVAHDFNNILTIIRSTIELMLIENEIEKSHFSEEIICELRKINQQTSRGADLVSNLMTLSRPSNKGKEPCKIEQIIDEVFKIQKKQFNLENIEIEKEYGSTAPVFLEKSQFQQVFLNLSINARHAIKPKGKGIISVSTREKNSAIEIIFSDNGIGMEKHVKANLFKPFFTTKRENDPFGIKGTGLGLSVTHEIIKNHAGNIKVKSETNKGTTFIVHIPINKNKQGLKEKNDRLAYDQIEALAAIKDLHILIIDDEEEITGNLRRLFKRLGCHEVEIAHSGQQALSLFEKRVFDVVFLDLLLPGMSGEIIFKKMNGLNKNIPFVLMSGNLDVKPESQPGHYYLKKPFKSAQLLLILEKIKKS